MVWFSDRQVSGVIVMSNFSLFLTAIILILNFLRMSMSPMVFPIQYSGISISKMA